MRFPLRTILPLIVLATGIAVAGAREISLRTLCFQHVDGLKEVRLVTGDAEKPVLTPVTLYTSTYSDPIEVGIAGDTLRFVTEAEGPDGKPVLKTVAEGKLAAGPRQLAIFLPSGDSSRPYRLTIIDESEKSFPMGSTLIYNLTGGKARFTIGEHARELEPGALGLLPLPTKVNALNQCTVRVFLTDKTGKWRPISSTVWRSSDEMRSLALAFIHPRSKQPTVQCLQETPPWRLPEL